MVIAHFLHTHAQSVRTQQWLIVDVIIASIVYRDRWWGGTLLSNWPISANFRCRNSLYQYTLDRGKWLLQSESTLPKLNPLGLKKKNFDFDKIHLKVKNNRKHRQEDLKGKFPQTTMRIGWGESNFRNPTVKVWADLDYPFKRSDYAKLCMSPSLDGTRSEYVISQEDNSPLTLYIDLQNF